MRRRALVLVALLAACGAPSEPPPPGALQKAVRAASSAAPCDKVIPLEWPASWPVPAGGKDGREFKVFFYPSAPTPEEKFWIGAPLGEATLEAGGTVTACRRFAGSPKALSGRRWPEAASRLGVDEFERKAGRLFALSETVAALYAAGRALTPDEAASAREYGQAFAELGEPDLSAHYRALNPDFWAWLAKAGSSSTP